MGKMKVLLPQPIEAEAVGVLEKNGVRLITAGAPKPEIVGPLMKEAQAIVLRTGIKMTRELLAYPNELMMISRTGAGVDNVDIPAATEQGIIVTSSIGVNTTSVAEHALALILALFKQLFLMDGEVRKGNFAIRYKNLPQDLREQDDRDRGVRADRLLDRPGVPHDLRHEGPGVRRLAERRAEGAIPGVGDVHRSARALPECRRHFDPYAADPGYGKDVRPAVLFAG